MNTGFGKIFSEALGQRVPPIEPNGSKLDMGGPEGSRPCLKAFEAKKIEKYPLSENLTKNVKNGT